MLGSLGMDTLRICSAEDLAKVDRLILPGGESTTMLRFIESQKLSSALQNFAISHPVWGICAGAILAAKTVLQPKQKSLGLINITAHRNFYGSQLSSFSAPLSVKGLTTPITAQFIRAPLLKTGEGPSVPEILAYHGETPVFFEQGNVWACSFHVELGADTSLHELFLTKPAVEAKESPQEIDKGQKLNLAAASGNHPIYPR